MRPTGREAGAPNPVQPRYRTDQIEPKRFDRSEMAKPIVSGPLATPTGGASRRAVLAGALSLAAGPLAGVRTAAAASRPGTARHAIAMHGEPAQAIGFAQF